jgi:hypothetical protein
MKYGIWVNDIGWLQESFTKDTNKDTYTANPSLWPTLAKAKAEAKDLNTLWRGRTHHYEARKYNK